MIWINLSQVGIFLIWNYRFSCTQLFQLQNYFWPHHLRIFFASKVFTLTFCCAIPRQACLVYIRYPSDVAKDITVSCTIITWACVHGVYFWVHPSAVINIPPRSGNISTTVYIEGKLLCQYRSTGKEVLFLSLQNYITLSISCQWLPPSILLPGCVLVR